MVRSAGLRGYEEVMRSLGVDPAPLLQRHRIPPGAIQDDDALLPLGTVAQLLESSSTSADCPDLGLRIAENYDIANLGALGVMVQGAETARDALELASRYLFIHSPGLVLSIHDHSPLIEDAIELTLEIRLPGSPPQRQMIDLTLGAAHKLFEVLLGKHYDLRLATLPHDPVAPLGRYRRFFDAPVAADQAGATLHLMAATLNASLPGGNPALKQITADYLSRHFRVPGDRVSTRVRLALRRVLGTQKASREAVAEMLAIHPRTLHRRLKEEGTSFEEIKETLRKDLALQFLTETQIPLSQLSGLLGFPEQSGFTRSCRRWFGRTPSSIRKGS
ncbi:AraC family transcriptional regulator [Paracoccus marinaquae]|uniref:AraC family transcriptional regulator n=1 Tax=Paracoccus marinaquae TaxID=2841926 RepID=A0ABS6AKJ9_9RHOB|nr:AraC family transcriptional regulator [Paracoccus marinaquae]MBU3031108.1 AraC family transcriptional regulator [Paracoccus marinaquae]